MQEKQLRQLMRLARRAGVPLIVADEQENFVLMGVEQFESLIGDDEIIENPMDFGQADEDDFEPALEVYGQDKMATIQTDVPVDAADDNHPRQYRQAPIEIENEVELPNVASAVPKSADFEEEERFYLEPID